MANVEMWFPVCIYKQEDLLSVEENQIVKDACLELQTTVPAGGEDWVGGTYNTHGTSDLLSDPRFGLLFERTAEHVHKFAEMFGSKGIYKNDYSWINVATTGNYQEFHTHNNNVFSVVYYAAATEGSGNIVFEDPKEPDMCGLKNVPAKTPLSFTRIGYPATEGMLLIFRSYLRHLVEPGTNTEPRISVAMNFN
jgi:uncharacterized protein (TIGR02466 family)|tara:strand:- start:5299 stop:5880 length:582 start_codon:yes stop_codon:yes gene_type:complete